MIERKMNMKKIFALLLSLMLLCGAAMAEESGKTVLASVNMNGAFELRCSLPEGYEIEEFSKEDAQQIWVIRGPEDKPLMTLSIAFDEMHADIARLNDLTAEQKAELEATWSEEDLVTVSYTTTDHGTELMCVQENRDTVDYVDFYTIYNGYDVEFVVISPVAEDGTSQGLTEEQIRMAVQFLSDMDFIPLEA